MTQIDELASVKRRIRAMAERTIENGVTEHEAETAMKKIGELLEQFNLTMDEVSVRQEVCTTVVYDTGSKHAGVELKCAVAIAKFTQTRVWQTRHRDNSAANGRKKASGVVKLNFFGLESDTQMAIFLCNLISKAYETEYAKFKNTSTYRDFYGHRKTLNANFLSGFGNRMYHKLNDLADERAAQERAAAVYHAQQMKDRMVEASDSAKADYARMTTGTALISVTKSAHVEQEFKKMGMKLQSKTTYNKRRANHESYNAGQQAANNVNLNRPLGNTKSTVNGFIK